MKKYLIGRYNEKSFKPAKEPDEGVQAYAAYAFTQYKDEETPQIASANFQQDFTNFTENDFKKYSLKYYNSIRK